MCNLQAVFNGVSWRLLELSLDHVRSVDLHQIIMRCSRVMTLQLDYCTYVPLKANTAFLHATPHFRSLTSLRIRQYLKDHMQPTLAILFKFRKN